MRSLAPLLAPLLLLAACGGGSSSGGGSGTLELVATDAPVDPSIFESAWVEVEKVRLHASTDDEPSSGWLTLYEGPPVLLNLVRLRNGLTRTFASGRLPAGTYRQVRLHISGGRLELKNGRVYSVEDGNLDFPSAMTSAGHKVFLDPGVVIPSGGREQVLFDFDLSKTFRPIPSNDPEQASRYSIHPVIRGMVTSISGEIRVTVRQDDGTGSLVGVPDAMVYVLPPGETDPENAVASSMTDDTGSAAVLGLLPGTYDVLAEKDGAQGRTDAVVVERGDSTAVDVVIL